MSRHLERKVVETEVEEEATVVPVKDENCGGGGN